MKPNLNNQILFPPFNESGIDDIESGTQRSAPCTEYFFGIHQHWRMDNKVVKLALSVLDKIRSQQYERNEKEQMNIRFKNIEKMLEIISNKFK